jgi:hypothetical protein
LDKDGNGDAADRDQSPKAKREKEVFV